MSGSGSPCDAFECPDHGLGEAGDGGGADGPMCFAGGGSCEIACHVSGDCILSRDRKQHPRCLSTCPRSLRAWRAGAACFETCCDCGVAPVDFRRVDDARRGDRRATCDALICLCCATFCETCFERRGGGAYPLANLKNSPGSEIGRANLPRSRQR